MQKRVVLSSKDDLKQGNPHGNTKASKYIFSPFIAHFYPTLHHNGIKVYSACGTSVGTQNVQNSFCSREMGMATPPARLYIASGTN